MGDTMRETHWTRDESEMLGRQPPMHDGADDASETGAETVGEGTGPITVLLADDHALVREGTRRLLEAKPDIRVVAEAGDGAEAVTQTQALRPAVVIMDIAMPGMGGIEATRQIKARHPQVAVLALTAYDDEQYVLALLDAGAAGFLLKDVRGEELVAAVRAVHRGESVLQPRIAQRALLRAVARRTTTSGPAPLSEREMDVLREAARGLPNKDIAKRLNLSVRTIHTHLGNAFNKLGVGSRTEAVLLALRRGWIALDETELPPGMTTTSNSAASSSSAGAAGSASASDFQPRPFPARPRASPSARKAIGQLRKQTANSRGQRWTPEVAAPCLSGFPAGAQEHEGSRRTPSSARPRHSARRPLNLCGARGCASAR